MSALTKPLKTQFYEAYAKFTGSSSFQSRSSCSIKNREEPKALNTFKHNAHFNGD